MSRKTVQTAVKALEAARSGAVVVEVRHEKAGSKAGTAPPSAARAKDGREIVSLPNRFQARPAQRRFMAHFDGGGRRAYLVAHRRYGKDQVALHEACKMAHEAKGQYWHCLPTEEQARKAIWTGFTKAGDRVMEQIFPRSIRKSPAEWSPNAAMVVELKCGSIFRLVGSDNIDSLVGSGPRHVTFSEFALSRPTAWPLIRPMVEEAGGSAAFLTTPRGKNHAWELWKLAQPNLAWFTETVDILNSGVFADPQAEMAKAHLEGMPQALIEQEYLCSWDAANVGSVWGDLLVAIEKAGGVGDFQHDRDTVYSSWDLGHRDATSIFLWTINRDGPGIGVDFIDHYSSTGKPLSHYMDWLEVRAQQMGYKYAQHYLPHDARAHSLQTGASTIELFAERYPNVEVTPSLSLADGIQAARWMFQQRVRFHSRCRDGLEALKAYAYEWDDESKSFSTKPDHSWASHDSDCARYVACVVRETELLSRPQEPKRKVYQHGWQALGLSDFSTITLDQHWEQHEAYLRKRGDN